RRPMDMGVDSQGRFAVDIGATDEPTTLMAEAPGCIPLIVEGIRTRRGVRTNVGTLWLEPGFATDGEVVDAAGAPVPYARVKARLVALPGRSGLPEDLLERSAEHSAIADSAGRFTLPDMTTGAYRVHGEAPGYAALAREVTVSPGTSLRVELQRTGWVACTLSFPGKQTRRVVRLTHADDKSITFQQRCEPDQAPILIFDHLVPGPYQLELRGPGNEPIALTVAPDTGTELVVEAR
ncbi:MAG: carboxypeptidase regulatory-like domain-containing protein, partial [bacterium]|nr:carboxypeptidase regulatory-like domain-containing protein [bacterium]